MDHRIYSLIHVISLLVLTAQTYMAFAYPDASNRKRTMIITGVASLGMLLGAGGLMAKLGYSWGSGWVIVKLVCWLGFTALAGMAYRRPELREKLSYAGFVLLLVALVMVYFKPGA